MEALVVGRQGILGASCGLLLEVIPLHRPELRGSKGAEDARIGQLSDGIAGTASKRCAQGGLRSHEIGEEVFGCDWQCCGLENRRDLQKDDAALAIDRSASRCHGAYLVMTGKAGRRGGVDAATQGDIDVTRNQIPNEGEMIGADDGSA